MPRGGRECRGADLVVHQVYGLKTEAERTYAPGHPTAAEAGRVARDAGARCLVLTPLCASRFADPEVLAAEVEASFVHLVEVAGDLMVSEL